MKTLATIVTVGLLFAAASESSAQVALTPTNFSIHSTQQAPYIPFPSTVRLAPLAVDVDTLSYFDPIGLQTGKWYFLPSGITYKANSGNDTLDLIQAYGERFTSNFTLTYLDSVTFLWAPTIASPLANNKLLVSAWNQRVIAGTTGPRYFQGTRRYKIDSSTTFTQDDVDAQLSIQTTIPFGHIRVDKNFFIEVGIADTSLDDAGLRQSAIILRGDSNTIQGGRAVDWNVDRGYLFTNAVQQVMAGVTYGDGNGGTTDPFYVNFLMVAWVSNTLNAVGPDGQPIFALEQNFPNPFNPSTDIRYSLAKTDHVSLKLMNALGQEVKTLVDGTEAAGEHTIKVDAAGLTSGTYFYTLRANGQSETRQMILKK